MSKLGPAGMPRTYPRDPRYRRQSSLTTGTEIFERALGTDAQFVTLAAEADLDNERVLTAGTAISIVDAGAGSTVTIAVDPSGITALASQFVTLAATSSLSNERVLTAGTGISIVDSGAGAAVTISVNTSAVDHGGLGGLSDDDHTQYALLAGRATPQTFAFGTASGAATGYLTSTAHATKGKYFLNAAGTIAVDEVNVRLGVGVASPSYKVHIATEFGSSSSTNLLGAFDVYGDTSRWTFRMANGTQASPTQTLAGDYIGNVNFRGYHSGGAFNTNANVAIAGRADENFTSTAQGTSLDISTTPVGATVPATVVHISSEGALIMGAHANEPSANATHCIVFTDNGATKPTLVSNTCAIYGKDVAGTVEVFVEDEAGNETQISPHNFSLIGKRSHPAAWAFYSENDEWKINVDMFRVVQLLEELTGEKLIYLEKK